MLCYTYGMLHLSLLHILLVTHAYAYVSTIGVVTAQYGEDYLSLRNEGSVINVSGMFDVNSSQAEHTGTPPGGSSGDKGRRMSRSDFDQNNLMKGVYGVGVHPSSPEKAGSVEDGSAEEEEVRTSIMAVQPSVHMAV